MSARYGIAFICDGCGARQDVWPETPLGVTPAIPKPPAGWMWARCRDLRHRVGYSGSERPGIPRHLAHVIACPACRPDMETWAAAVADWKARRHAIGESWANLLTIGWAVCLWKEANPRPPYCWPGAVHGGWALAGERPCAPVRVPTATVPE